MRKQRQNLRKAGVVHQMDGINADGAIRLSNSERRIIRNYRAMERIAQKTFEEISEEFACTLPALGRQSLRLAKSQHLEACQ